MGRRCISDVISGIGAERGSVPKAYSRPGYWAHRELTSSFISRAVDAAVEEGRKSNHGFAREITETLMLWASMNAIFSLTSQYDGPTGRPRAVDGVDSESSPGRIINR